MSFNRFLAKLRPQVLERKQEAHLVINSLFIIQWSFMHN